MTPAHHFAILSVFIVLITVTSEQICDEGKNPKILNETTCDQDSLFCDLGVLSSGCTNIIINSPGTFWAVAEGNVCSIEQLTLQKAALIDISVLKSCSNLGRIRLQGSGYDCSNSAWLKFLESFPWTTVSLNAYDSYCSKETESRQDIVMAIISMEIKKKCGNVCKCFVLKDYSVLVECANKGLGESDLPNSLPFSTSKLELENNTFTNLDSWFAKVLPELSNVKQINLNNNQFQKLPILPESGNPIKHLYIQQNQRAMELDANAIKTYINYEKLALSFRGTNWTCNCETRDFLDFLINNTKYFSDYSFMYCGNGERPWTWDYSHCSSREPYDKRQLLYIPIVFLTIVDIFVIAIFVDLNRIIWREKMGLTNPRPPIIHSIFVKITGKDMFEREI